MPPQHRPLRARFRRRRRAPQFQHRHLARLVKKVLKDTGLDPRLLDLELTESLLMNNTEAVLGTMDELHAHGVAFSMDDFGTG